MFQLVNGIGEKLAKELVKKYGEPDSLESAYACLEKEEGLPKATVQELKYRPIKIIPRNIIAYFEKDLGSGPHIICGSYRRLLPYSGDIDIVVMGDPAAVMTGLPPEYDVVEPYASGPDRVSCLIGIGWLHVPLYVKVDFFTATEENFAYMVFYATGSKKYNILMRLAAKKKGLLLNQFGLYNAQKELLPARSEEQICQLLGVKYLRPYERI